MATKDDDANGTRRSEEAMDDAVVDYSQAAGYVSRFRNSTADRPVPSGAFMRPTVPSTNVHADLVVTQELVQVRNRMFRLESMLKEKQKGIKNNALVLFRPCLLLKILFFGTHRTH